MNTALLVSYTDRHEPAIFADAPDVARRLSPDLPVFCFSAAALQERAKMLFECFPGEVTYAVKANPEAHVLATLASAGCKTWDVASIEEMNVVRSISAPARFHYHNPVKSRLEIREAYVR